jgi:hypothetical protein
MQSDSQLCYSFLFSPSYFLRSVSLDPPLLCGYERDLRPVLCGWKNWGPDLIERGHGVELKDRIDLTYSCWTVLAVKSHGARQRTPPPIQYIFLHWELSVFVATLVTFRCTFEITECTVSCSGAYWLGYSRFEFCQRQVTAVLSKSQSRQWGPLLWVARAPCEE